MRLFPTTRQSHRDMAQHFLNEPQDFKRLTLPWNFDFKSLEKRLMKTDQNMTHLNHLNEVVDGDTAHIIDKEKTYGGSWKRRGGVGVFMMLARKWDRLENMMRQRMTTVYVDTETTVNPADDDRPIGTVVVDEQGQHPIAVANEPITEYDILSRIRSQVGNQPIPKDAPDGTILAEIRDLRRYLILVEAELLRESHDKYDDLQSRRNHILSAPLRDGGPHYDSHEHAGPNPADIEYNHEPYPWKRYQAGSSEVSYGEESSASESSSSENGDNAAMGTAHLQPWSHSHGEMALDQEQSHSPEVVIVDDPHASNAPIGADAEGNVLRRR